MKTETYSCDLCGCANIDPVIRLDAQASMFKTQNSEHTSVSLHCCMACTTKLKLRPLVAKPAYSETESNYERLIRLLKELVKECR